MWAACPCPSQIPALNSAPRGWCWGQGLWEVMSPWGWGPREWHQCPRKRAPSLLLPGEDAVERQPSVNREAGPPQTQNLPAAGSWAPRLQTVRITAVCTPLTLWRPGRTTQTDQHTLPGQMHQLQSVMSDVAGGARGLGRPLPEASGPPLPSARRAPATGASG